MPTIFSKIITGEIPSYKVHETPDYLAFLDINPNSKGHTLCIPKVEVNRIFDLDRDTYVGLMEFSRDVAKAIEKTVPCERIGMSVIGLEVPHVHVHLIPLKTMEDARFTSKVSLTDDEMMQLANSISSHIIQNQ